MLDRQFRVDEYETGDDREQRHPDDEGRMEPVVALPFLEHHLKCGEPDGSRREAGDVDGSLHGELALRRVDGDVRHEKPDQNDREIDKEYPAPVEILGEPASKRRTDDGT